MFADNTQETTAGTRGWYFGYTYYVYPVYQWVSYFRFW
jgi:hypothetical protein